MICANDFTYPQDYNCSKISVNALFISWTKNLNINRSGAVGVCDRSVRFDFYLKFCILYVTFIWASFGVWIVSLVRKSAHTYLMIFWPCIFLQRASTPPPPPGSVCPLPARPPSRLWRGPFPAQAELLQTVPCPSTKIVPSHGRNTSTWTYLILHRVHSLQPNLLSCGSIIIPDKRSFHYPESILFATRKFRWSVYCANSPVTVFLRGYFHWWRKFESCTIAEYDVSSFRWQFVMADKSGPHSNWAQTDPQNIPPRRTPSLMDRGVRPHPSPPLISWVRPPFRPPRARNDCHRCFETSFVVISNVVLYWILGILGWLFICLCLSVFTFAL